MSENGEFCKEVGERCTEILHMITPELHFYDEAMKELEGKEKTVSPHDRNYAKVLSILGFTVAAVKDFADMLEEKYDGNGETTEGDCAGTEAEEVGSESTGQPVEGTETISEGDGTCTDK